MCNTLNSAGSESPDEQVGNLPFTVPQTFRDAFACHLYMLYTIMVFTESEIKAGKAMGNANVVHQSSRTGGGRKGTLNKKEKERRLEAEQTQQMREACAEAILAATSAMAKNQSILWKRGVPDESLVGLPCRISYQMLENATGVVARKLASADVAMKVIAITIDSVDSFDKNCRRYLTCIALRLTITVLS